jgi:hypothetical protein
MTKAKAQWIGRGLALLGAGLAVVFSSPFTLWFLVNDGGTTIWQYVGFALMCAVLAAVGSIPGLVVGRVLARKALSETSGGQNVHDSR